MWKKYVQFYWTGNKAWEAFTIADISFYSSGRLRKFLDSSAALFWKFVKNICMTKHENVIVILPGKFTSIAS